MEFGKSKLELKVGAFVFFGLVILSIFVLLVGNFKTWLAGYRVNFLFHFANGVRVGAPVRFAGVDVGEVKDIHFLPDSEEKVKVRVVCWVKEEIKIPLDSTIWVNTLGLLGEKYIEIMPGTGTGPFLVSEQTLIGVDPIPMHEVVRLARSFVSSIDESLGKLKNKEGTLGKLLYDDTLYRKLEEIISSREGTIGKLFYDDSLYRQLEAVLKNKEGTIGKLLYSSTLYEEMEGLIKDVREHPWKLLHVPRDRR